MARPIRCSYCYTQGHSRNNCPTAKQSAANGDAYAQRVIERSKVKQCSYCHHTDHTKATCEKLYSDERLKVERKWCGVLGLIEVIREKKIAAGAFLYGPVAYHGGMPDEDTSYESINYCIEEIKIRQEKTDREHSSMVRYNTLAEPKYETERFCGYAPMPHLYDAVYNLETEFKAGKEGWLRNNAAYGYKRMEDARARLSMETEVIVPAEDITVSNTIVELLAMKPLILKSNDRKTYQKQQRAANKAEKAARDD